MPLRVVISLCVLLQASAIQVESGSAWWPWSRKKTETQAEGRASQAQAAATQNEVVVGYPAQPGCYMRMPSGCPKKPMKTKMWRHDTWAEKQLLNATGCKERKIVWDKYCETDDSKMVFVEDPNAPKPVVSEPANASSEPVSALQLGGEAEAEEEWWPWQKKKQAARVEDAQAAETKNEVVVGYPQQPGCFMRMPSGCPKKPMKTKMWRHDTWAEKQGLNATGCKERKAVWDKYCETDDSKMVFVAKPEEAAANASEPISALQMDVSAETEEEWWPWSKKKDSVARESPAQSTAAENEVVVGYPSQPGCFMRMPSGCPKKPMKTKMWRHDTWAEKQALNATACRERKMVWDKYCDTDDSKMVYVEAANSTEAQ